MHVIGIEAPIFDEFVKSPKGPFFVIPAYEPESIIFKELQKTWTPFFNGVTTFYETINFCVTKYSIFVKVAHTDCSTFMLVMGTGTASSFIAGPCLRIQLFFSHLSLSSSG